MKQQAAAGDLHEQSDAANERQNELVTVAFAGEADYLRGTDLAFAGRNGVGLELTDVPRPFTARLRPWLLQEVRDRCSLHLLSRAPRGERVAERLGAGSTSHVASPLTGAGGATAALPATRIQILCPSGNAPRFRAANETLVALLGDEHVQRWGGLTYSSIAEPAFTGAFWDRQAAGWLFDRHVLILIDAVETQTEASSAYATRLHDLVAGIYARHGQRQQRLWVTTQPLTIIGVSSVAVAFPWESKQRSDAFDGAAAGARTGDPCCGHRS